MITYAGLARIVAVVAGALAAGLPPGHPAMRALTLALGELRSLARLEDAHPAAPGYTLARGLDARPLWRHPCGHVITHVFHTPPGYCEQCTQTGGWEQLYVNSAGTPN